MLDNKLTYERAQELFDIPSKTLEVKTLMSDLKNALETEKDAIGISAPQIGKDVRAIALRFTDGVHYFFNPLSARTKDLKIVVESWYGKKYLHPRFNSIEFCYQKANGIPEQMELTDYPAYAFQQHLELLDGVTPDLIGLEVDDEFFNADKETQDAIVTEYLESIQRIQESLKKEIEEDPALRDRQRAIDFQTSVATGETVTLATQKPKQPNRATRRANAKRTKKLLKEVELANKLEAKANDRKANN